ncbi:ATP-binding protein [Rhizobium sp. BR 249]
MDRNEIGTAVASPTKQFFVRMLTRDIELSDALLDLLDNCVDGILRSGQAKADGLKPYEGFNATLTLSKDHFSIEDNCGGIPYAIAQKYAFAMGRPPGVEEGGTQGKVGMYGIGMKRAIFKLGSDARIESRNDRSFFVEINAKWMGENSWNDLPIYELPEGSIEAGSTKIFVTKLHPDISLAFAQSKWIDEFRKAIARHYAIIIEKGFSVVVGTPDEIARGLAPIKAEPFRLLLAKPDHGGQMIEPFIYNGKIRGVDVEIYAGLYRPLLNEDELDEEDDTRASTDDAGWTVACNDRIVIWKDKTKLTGWGEGTVPNYHGQFIAITGIVLLRADDPKKLPLTTTKRGIEGASDVYLDVKDIMRDSTKALTSFTNKWKRFPEKLATLYQASEYADLPGLRSIASSAEMDTVRKYPEMKKVEPRLPVPPEEKTSTRVSFVALKKDVEFLGKHFFDDAKAKPAAVGEAAFNQSLGDAKK